MYWRIGKVWGHHSQLHPSNKGNVHAALWHLCVRRAAPVSGCSIAGLVSFAEMQVDLQELDGKDVVPQLDYWMPAHGKDGDWC